MDPERQKRKEEIEKALGFIQSSLPFPDPEGYEAFLTQLVCNLLDEGNTVFRDGDWRQAASHYSEGVNVARYAQSEALVIPAELLESLYVNRAAAHYSLGEYERGVQDCDSALCVSEGSRRALYRKALCLRELGRFREAYECGTGCLLTAPHDRQVGELAQDLAKKLGLKIRKAYISSQGDSTTSQPDSNGETPPSTGEVKDFWSAQKLGNSCFLNCIPAPLATPIPVSDDPPMPPLSPIVPPETPESPSQGPTGRVQYSVPVSEQMGECVINEDLESLLENIPKGAEVSVNPVQGAIPTNLPNTAVGLRPPYPSGLPPSSSQLTPPYFGSAVSPLTQLDSFSTLGQSESSTQAMESLIPFGSASGAADAAGRARAGSLSTEGLDSLSEYTLPGGRINTSFIPGLRNHAIHTNGSAATNLSLLSRNPLAATHEFRQACHACYSRIGPRVMDYKYQPEAAHRCKRDVLLCRLKTSDDTTWKRIRPRPARNNFLGAFVLCKGIFFCYSRYGYRCQERRGVIRYLLCFNIVILWSVGALRLPLSGASRSNTYLLCFNIVLWCLVHVVRSANVRYSKIRPLHPLCQFDVCRHEVRYGCQREDSCSFAHSVIELKCWVLQQDTGITHEEMVQESKRHWQRLEQNAQRQKPMHVPHHTSSSSSSAVSAGVGSGGVAGGGGDGIGGGGSGGGSCGRGRGLNLKMKFVCGQCWREGQVNEPDKALKYCTAKAKHSWTKERRVLLVKSFEKKKWVVVRPLPFSRTYPQQYDMCVHVMKQKKCHYIGNCSFAHSLEERDVWTYMKNNSLRDMQQMYDLWLSLTNQNRRPDGTLMTPPPEEKPSTMPADYTEAMAGQRLSGSGDL
uniref:Zinc finger CCCH-type containing 7Bb n=1 Tax=Astyanax mexicanus TaxID=7994 RepID=W5KN74_ASTMX